MAIEQLPRIAVLLAAYNGRRYIEEQIDSILSQQNVDCHLYISVDQSTDDTLAWCHALARQRGNVTVLPYGARFGGAARNFFRLIRDVSFDGFDYVAYADQDDLWLPGKLDRAVSKLVQTGSAGYSSNVTAFWPDGRERLIEKSQSQRQWDYLFEAAGPGCTYLLRLDLALAVKAAVIGNWAEINKLGLHDWFSYAFARANGFAWFIDAWPSMLYRQHLGNEVGANSGWKAFYYRLKKVADGWGVQQSALTAHAVGMEKTQFVRQWIGFGRFGFIKLAWQANKCRRKPVERLYFFFACMLLAIVGKRSS